MNGRPVTDAQISQALRAHLPTRAQAGLRERILESAEITSQQRALPSFLGALSEADPVGRRRGLLIAAALLLAVALASAVAVGAWRLLQRDPIKDLSLEPPTDVPAFVLSSHDRMPQLPPVAITTLGSDATKDRIYVDRSGAVRVERYASADATEPGYTAILSGTRVGGTQTVGSNKVWIVNDEAISDDPRVFILSLSGLAFSGGSGCETSLDPSDAGSATAATGWRYVGAESVAGRPAHHLACASGDIWIDDATRLVLRVRQPDLDGAGNPVPGAAFRTTEVTKIEFGEQPPALFALTPPNGVAAMTTEAYGALCPGDTTAFQERPCSGTPQPTPTPDPAPSPTPTVRPSPGDCAIPPHDASKPAGPLAWNPASLKQDWPAPIRTEPPGGASVAPMPPTYIDPAGDTEAAVLSCIDIRDVTVGDYLVSLNLVDTRPPDVDPSKAWIAYGVVVDEDRDGVPDWRYGIDNLPRTAGDKNGHHREWRTDLHTGRTESVSGPDWASVSDTFLVTGYPAEGREDRRFNGADAGFEFGHVSDVAGQGTVTRGVKVNVPLYAWASVIVDGRVVATDYAPDTGWLLPTPGANPGGTYDLPGVLGADLPFHLSMTIPDGWSGGGGPRVADVRKGDEGDEGIGLEFMIIDEPLAIGCDRGEGKSSNVPIGPSVDDLVKFLEGLQTKKVSDKTDVATFKVSANKDVIVDGYRGKYLEYTATVRDDNCGHGGWPAIGSDEYTQAVWILDVEGVRLVIHGSAPTARETARAELQLIVDSIRIEP